jgi:hypothetical protein
MGSLFGSAFEGIFGGGDPGTSGSFPDNRELGEAFQAFLLERLNTPPADTESFRLGSQAIRDAITTQSATARQRFGDAATTGGFLDSGALTSGLLDIDRAGSAAFASQIRDLLLALEDRRMEGVVPFLTGASGEHLGRAGLQQRSAEAGSGFFSEQTGQFTEFASSAPIGGF